ncbi:hypothetical protein V866_003806 [Kwoniella sp. B9012]
MAKRASKRSKGAPKNRSVTKGKKKAKEERIVKREKVEEEVKEEKGSINEVDERLSVSLDKLNEDLKHYIAQTLAAVVISETNFAHRALEPSSSSTVKEGYSSSASTSVDESSSSEDSPSSQLSSTSSVLSEPPPLPDSSRMEATLLTFPFSYLVALSIIKPCRTVLLPHIFRTVSFRYSNTIDLLEHVTPISCASSASLTKAESTKNIIHLNLLKTFKCFQRLIFEDLQGLVKISEAILAQPTPIQRTSMFSNVRHIKFSFNVLQSMYRLTEQDPSRHVKSVLRAINVIKKHLNPEQVCFGLAGTSSSYQDDTEMAQKLNEIALSIIHDWVSLKAVSWHQIRFNVELGRFPLRHSIFFSKDPQEWRLRAGRVWEQSLPRRPESDNNDPEKGKVWWYIKFHHVLNRMKLVDPGWPHDGRIIYDEQKQSDVLEYSITGERWGFYYGGNSGFCECCGE